MHSSWRLGWGFCGEVGSAKCEPHLDVHHLGKPPMIGILWSAKCLACVFECCSKITPLSEATLWFYCHLSVPFLLFSFILHAKIVSSQVMQSGHTASTPASTKLRHFLENSKDILLCPGVYDGFSARIALSVGFDALYMVR
jgi:hypothetical protein